MRMITITNEEIIESLKDYDGNEFMAQCYLDLVKKIHEGKLTCDKEGDILASTVDGNYWITTTPVIRRYNKAGDYEINIQYDIHEGSKYSDVVFSFTN